MSTLIALFVGAFLAPVLWFILKALVIITGIAVVLIATMLIIDWFEVFSPGSFGKEFVAQLKKYRSNKS